MAVFVTTMGAGLVAPLLPVYAHELGAGGLQIGLIFGAFSLTRTIFVPYFGKLSDPEGKKTPVNVWPFHLLSDISALYRLKKRRNADPAQVRAGICLGYDPARGTGLHRGDYSQE